MEIADNDVQILIEALSSHSLLLDNDLKRGEEIKGYSPRDWDPESEDHLVSLRAHVVEVDNLRARLAAHQASVKA